jgi:hypothetical protein
MFSVLVKSLYEDLGEDPWSQTHLNSNLTKNISVVDVNYFHANFPPTLIGLFSVL